MNIEFKVKDIIATQAGITIDKVPLEGNLSTDFNLDSLDGIEIVMAVEEEFGIEITDDEAEKLTTVQEIVNIVTAKT